jgi:glycosyltransferase involved in cell wall biosynthesis
MSAPRVLHVIPHPGGGGETYIGHLDGIEGYRFDRLALTEHGRPYETPGGLARLRRAAPDYELLHVHGDSAALVSLPVLGKRPAVITLNGVHLARRTSGVRGRLVRGGLRRAFERSVAVIAVSEAERDLVRELAPAAADRVELIHNGVPEREPPGEDERRATREALGVDPDAVIALFAAELTERKQPVQFAEAVGMARVGHPELVGLVLGEGPLRGRLESMQGEGLRLLGHRGDFVELVGAADIVVLPSLWEGLAYAALEAMALGRATVVSDGPGNPDAVGEAGLVFPVGDVPAMAAAIERLAGDPALRRSLGDAALRRARERFTVPGMVEATAAVYRRALEEGR